MSIGISAVGSQSGAGIQQLLSGTQRTPNEQELQVREKFQEFVSGTFYKQMLKALRSTQGKPAYFHGGQAEEMFQGQMDQYVTDDLARNQGKTFADPLFSVYARR